jgi:small multidrug resistance pump
MRFSQGRPYALKATANTPVLAPASMRPLSFAFRHDLVQKSPDFFEERAPPPMPWLYLSIAIVSEVVATSALKSAEGFTRLVPSLAVIAGYALAFYFLSLTLRAIPVGVAYAIWSGVGIALVSLISWIIYKQSLSAGEMTGMGLIVAGVIVLSLYSKGVH